MHGLARPASIAGAAALFFKRDTEGAVAKRDGGSDAAADVDVNVFGRRGPISGEDPDAAGAVIKLECGADALDAEGRNHAALDGDILIAEMFGMGENFGNWFCAAADSD